MNCVELRESLAVVDDGTGVEQRAHLRLCRECSALVAELNSIAHAAVELRAADEPDPRVWKSIEASLRREGLIRRQRTSRSLLPSFGSPWGMARWLVPAAAALLIVIGVYVRPHARQDAASNPPAPVVSANGPELALVGLNDDDLMQEVDQQNPAMKEQYAENLRRVNQYIQDAKTVVAAEPNDEEARRSLMEAYQEKAMLFELALDRSLQ